tara:strand:- start:781 stop:2310 length:1530 start_codon:yes stop_codon:yes gene_type:complete
MEKTQQIILTSSHERIEFSLWTLGLPYRVSTLNEILELDVVKLSINVFICFSSDEEETLLERDNQCLIFRVFENTTEGLKSSSKKVTHSWDLSQLPFEVGFPQLNWCSSQDHLNSEKMNSSHVNWKSCGDTIIGSRTFIYWGLNFQAIFDLQSTQSLAFGYGHKEGGQPNQSRWPHEEVSSLDRGSVLILFRESLRYLLSSKGIPLHYLPDYPQGYEGVFLYRIDTDGADFNSLKHYVDLLDENQVKATLFLDTAPIENSINQLELPSNSSQFEFPLHWEKHEWGVHCYQHRTLADMKMNEKNFKQGKILAEQWIQNFESSELQLKGHAAPYGLHPQGLGELQNQLGFEYGSEFSFAYDSFPLHLNNDKYQKLGWQIPWHPICPHSLMNSQLDVYSWMKYFTDLGTQQFNLSLPQTWYDHPMHKDLESLEVWIKFLGLWVQGLAPHSKKLCVMTAHEYLNWRQNERYHATQIECPTPQKMKSEQNHINCRKFNLRQWKQSLLRKHFYRN